MIRARFEHLTTVIPHGLVERIREAVQADEFIYDQHALDKLVELAIHPTEADGIVLNGTPIEYDNGTGEHAAGVLFNGVTSGGRPLHVKMAERRRGPYVTWVVTVYEPRVEHFEQNFSVRISSRQNEELGQRIPARKGKRR